MGDHPSKCYEIVDFSSKVNNARTIIPPNGHQLECADMDVQKLQAEIRALSNANSRLQEENDKLTLARLGLLKEIQDLGHESTQLEERRQTLKAKVASLSCELDSRQMLKSAMKPAPMIGLDISMVCGNSIHLDSISVDMEISSFRKLVAREFGMSVKEISLCIDSQLIVPNAETQTLRDIGLWDGASLTCVRHKPRVRFTSVHRVRVSCATDLPVFTEWFDLPSSVPKPSLPSPETFAAGRPLCEEETRSDDVCLIEFASRVANGMVQPSLPSPETLPLAELFVKKKHHQMKYQP